MTLLDGLRLSVTTLTVLPVRGGRVDRATAAVAMAVAPLVVAQAGAPRFLNPADYPGGPTRRMRLVEARPVGDVVLLRYLPKPA